MKTVIEMARESNLMDSRDDWGSVPVEYEVAINAFAEIVRADEREACAQIAEALSATTYECTVACGGPEQTFQQRMPKDAHEIAKEIRARGQA